jgi:Tfp pilus assembly protein PilV
MMKDSRKNKNQRGQSLVELLVAVGLAAILITAVVNLGNASTRRTTASRQANQASKLAQEGMEIIRHIRDNNFTDGVSGFCNPLNTWGSLYTCDLVGDVNAGLAEANVSGNASYTLTSGGTETITLDTAEFTRQVTLNDDAASQCNPSGGPDPLDYTKAKRVIVDVSWDSPTGDQTRRAVTCITKWQ